VSALPLFHLAFPVNDIAQARQFYGDLLGCSEGRSAETWVDFNFYGHQIVAHLAPSETGLAATGEVDHDDVPVRHFGAILAMAECPGRPAASPRHALFDRAARAIQRPGG
jgi:uncharacterized protein